MIPGIKGVVFSVLKNQKMTPKCLLVKAAEQVEDKREEYKEVLLQLNRMLKRAEPHNEWSDRLMHTYEQMKEYALFVQSIEMFLRSSAKNEIIPSIMRGYLFYFPLRRIAECLVGPMYWFSGKDSLIAAVINSFAA